MTSGLGETRTVSPQRRHWTGAWRAMSPRPPTSHRGSGSAAQRSANALRVTRSGVVAHCEPSQRTTELPPTPQRSRPSRPCSRSRTGSSVPRPSVSVQRVPSPRATPAGPATKTSPLAAVRRSERSAPPARRSGDRPRPGRSSRSRGLLRRDHDSARTGRRDVLRNGPRSPDISRVVSLGEATAPRPGACRPESPVHDPTWTIEGTTGSHHQVGSLTRKRLFSRSVRGTGFPPLLPPHGPPPGSIRLRPGNGKSLSFRRWSRVVTAVGQFPS